MTKLDLYQIDAFTDKVFGGNPAAVCPLDTWLPDEILQKIALENNLSETAFFIKTPQGYHIRWFTPEAEVNLCGHATLATAYVIFNFIDNKATDIAFDSLSGTLHVRKNNDGSMMLNFPTWDREEQQDIPPVLEEIFGAQPSAYFKGNDDLIIFEDQDTIEHLSPDMRKMAELECARGIIVTAPAKQNDGTIDFVSRAFFPRIGIPEDPVTGSAHCILTPYWANRLGKTTLHAYQASPRGGYLNCVLNGNRVEISGHATLYLRGEIYI